jgi:hypothetical protein
MSLNKLLFLSDQKFPQELWQLLSRATTALNKSYGGTLLRAAAGPEQELSWVLRSLSVEWIKE